MIEAGKLNKVVTLSRKPQVSNDSDGFWEALSPEKVYAAIEPFSPGEGLKSIQHVVTLRYHPQVTFDTRLVYGTRQLFVRGIQNVSEKNAEMRLLCEEVTE